MRLLKLIPTFSVVISLFLGGCGGVSETVADLLNPPSDAEMAARIGDLTRSGRVEEAITKGEKFVSGAKSPPAQAHQALAQAYLQKGDAVNAARHMGMVTSAGGGAASSVTTTITTVTESATPSAQPAPRTAQPAPPGTAAATPGASARVNPDGSIEVQAGGVRARAP